MRKDEEKHISNNLESFRDYARILLAGIRLLNGAAALFAPTLLARQFGDTPNHSVIYALRLFGVRTIIIGIELLVPDEESRAIALRYAIPIHASDTLSAALAGMHTRANSFTYSYYAYRAFGSQHYFSYSCTASQTRRIVVGTRFIASNGVIHCLWML